VKGRAWVKEWDERGFARLESVQLPGELIFCHFTAVDPEYDSRLSPGQLIDAEWIGPLVGDQDGCRFMAEYVRPLDE
jgi:hypothetical protein